MRPSSFLLLAALCVRGFAAEPPGPDPQLVRLEGELTRKLDERKRGSLPPDQYRAFAAQFRDELDKALAHAPPTPVNRGRHALILSRLDESGPGQALAGLDRALAAAPNDPALINAKGSIQFQQGDYQGAFASASAILKYNQEHGQPPDADALSLYHSSKGRGTPGGAPAAAPPVVTHGQGASAAAPSAPPPTIQFTQRPVRARMDVPLELSEEKSSEASLLSRGKAAVLRAKESAVSGIDWTVLYVGRQLGIRSEQEETVVKDAHKGGKNLAKFGVVAGGTFGAVACSPGIATGAGYVGCVGAAGTVGGAGGYVVGSYWGGLSSHVWTKTKSLLGQLSINPEKKPEEE